MMLKAINIMIGVGNAISASIGANMTKHRLNIKAMPSDVAPKSVGNMLGCESLTAAKLALIEKRQKPTRVGVSHPEFASVMNKMILKPERAYRTEKVMRVFLGFQIVIRYAVRKMAGTSVDIMISALTSNSPGKCFL